MEKFNSYLHNLDYDALKMLFLEHGEKHIYNKKDYFVKQNELSRFAGYVEEGAFQYSYVDSVGDEHVVGYAFKNEFVGDYPSLIKGGFSSVSIQTVSQSVVYELPVTVITDYWNSDSETQKTGRLMAENLFVTIYGRFLESYCSPEIRYMNLMKRFPDLKNIISLKSIASYLGVSPETVSHIRKKLLTQHKS